MNYEQRGQMRHHLGAYLLVRGAMGGAEGRIKDVIICGGENIYPREIEDFLFADPPSPRRRSSAFRTSSGVRW